MDITVVIKIAAVGILVAILNSILSRSGRDDYAMIVALAGIAAVLMMLLPQLVTLLESAGTILDF
ncbi:MAG: stage III sporulation protein AC [Clostridia bacterium]|nr:stage III sporulation protein AC [Clostridia bacterium]